jgi:hypothetical protein
MGGELNLRVGEDEEDGQSTRTETALSDIQATTRTPHAHHTHPLTLGTCYTIRHGRGPQGLELQGAVEPCMYELEIRIGKHHDDDPKLFPEPMN